MSMRRPLTGLSSAMLLSSLGTSSANVALPTLVNAFDATFADVQWVVLAYVLAITTLIVPVGRLGDLVGRRRLLLTGVALYALASVVCGLAPSLGILVAGRVLQGAGAAIMMALTLTLVADTVPKERTGMAVGLLGTMSAAGTALGPSLGGLLITASDWRAIFLLNLPLGLVTLLLIGRGLEADARRATDWRSLDLPGTALLGLTVAASGLATTVGGGRLGPLNGALAVAAALGLVTFLRVQARAPAPLVPLPLLRAPRLRASLAIHALVSTVMMATLVVGPFHLSQALGLDPAGVGLALAVGPLVATAAGVPAGRFVDTCGAPVMIAIGLTAMAATSLMLAMLPLSAGLAGYLGPMIGLTAGYAVVQAANTTAAMRDVVQAERGVVSGLLTLARHLGLSAGASVMGAVFLISSPVVDVATAGPARVAASTRHTFAAATLLVCAALVIEFLSRNEPVGALARWTWIPCLAARRVPSRHDR